jgi:L-alanine-DL-glutamate epimerase-like enolase superfamily enzyme
LERKMESSILKRKVEIRRFRLKRVEDESGISGTGYVAEGVQFSDGQCVISWLTATTSTGIYHSVVEMIHIHGHGGKTVVEWIDDDGLTGSGSAVEGTGENKEQSASEESTEPDDEKTHSTEENSVDNSENDGTIVKNGAKKEVVEKLKEVLNKLESEDDEDEEAPENSKEKNKEEKKGTKE